MGGGVRARPGRTRARCTCRPPGRLLTDNGPPLADQFTRRLPEVASVVRVTVFSIEIGYTKPHPEAFLAACQRLGCDPEHVVFVDDKPANVIGAQKVGLNAVQYTTVRALADDLRNYGLLR